MPSFEYSIVKKSLFVSLAVIHENEIPLGVANAVNSESSIGKSVL